MRVLKVLARILRLNRVRLQQKDTCDNLKTVVDSMTHFLKEKILLSQYLLFFAFQCATHCDIFDRHQEVRAVVALIKYLSGIQQHRAPTDHREVVFDLELFDRGVVRDDLREKFMER